MPHPTSVFDRQYSAVMSIVDELSRQLDFWGSTEVDEDFIDDDDDEDFMDDDDEGEKDHSSTCSDDNVESSSDEESSVAKDEGVEDAEKEFYLGRDETTRWRRISDRVETKSEDTTAMCRDAKRTAEGAPTPLEAWKLLVDEQMLKDVLKNTNAKIRLKTAYYDADHQYQVRQTTLPELRAVLGLLYFAGIYRSNGQRLEDLWNANGTGIEIFRLTMSFFRFTFLISFLSLDDFGRRAERQKTDKLAPVRDIFERFAKNCHSSYTAGKYLTICRRIEKFRGPCPFRQFVPKTLAKCGIKFFTLLDAKLCYVLNMDIYRGVEGTRENADEHRNIVDRLVAPVSQSERTVTIDGSLASYGLMIHLLKNHKLTSVGRVGRDEKEIPDCFSRCKSGEKKTSIFGFRDDISVISYVGEDEKRVLMLSTLHRDASRDESGKPEVINFHDYTKKSGDLFDELSSTYDVSRNSRRWPLAIFFALLNIAGINSQIIYKLNTNSHATKRRAYLQELAHALVGEHLQNRKNNQRIPREIRQRIGQYFGDPVEAYRKRRNVHGRCALCPREKDRKSFYGCAGCHRYICLAHAVFYCEDCCGACEED